MARKTVVIIGALGFDFHCFNTVFRDNEEYDVKAFTMAGEQNVGTLDGVQRKYPAELAGKLYPKGIPIYAEEGLPELIKKHNIDGVVFAYSDVPYEYVMHKAAQVNAAGADFMLLDSKTTSLKSKVPVISICAVRTGCGKSQTTRRVSEILKSFGKKVVAIRHPMPYGDLAAQRVQRFATYEDMNTHKCTIEEREEYEPHIDRGVIVYAGVDYGAILEQAEQEADIILWDGGNNDTSFYKSDLHIVIADPLRAGNEISYYPGETNLLMADVVIINKIDTADYENVEYVRKNVREVNPDAIIIDAASPLTVEDPNLIHGKKALVVEDGPTLTHGGMTFGAGVVAAEKFGVAEIVDPRPYVTGKIEETFQKYPDIGILNPKILYYKSNKIHSMGGKIFYLLGMFRNIGKGKNSENYKDVIDPEFATGCAMLIKREVIKKVGMLDPIYFAYCEDADFSLRAKRKGYKIRVIPSAIIFHKKSATSGFAGSDRLSNLQAYLKARNGIIFAKNLEEWKFLGYICGQFTFRLIYHLSVIKDFKSFISYMNGIYDGLEFLLQGKINEENLRKRF